MLNRRTLALTLIALTGFADIAHAQSPLALALPSRPSKQPASRPSLPGSMSTSSFLSFADWRVESHAHGPLALKTLVSISFIYGVFMQRPPATARR